MLFRSGTTVSSPSRPTTRVESSVAAAPARPRPRPGVQLLVRTRWARLREGEARSPPAAERVLARLRPGRPLDRHQGLDPGGRATSPQTPQARGRVSGYSNWLLFDRQEEPKGRGDILAEQLMCDISAELRQTRKRVLDSSPRPAQGTGVESGHSRNSSRHTVAARFQVGFGS